MYYSSSSDLPTSSSQWFSAILLYLVGLLIKICIDLLKHILNPILANHCLAIQYISIFVLIYLDATFGVVMWVGGFNLLNIFPGVYWVSLTSVLLISTCILMLIQAFHCTSGTPLSICRDDYTNILTPSSYFGTALESSSLFKVVLDTLFSYGVVHSLVICVWWAMWELENQYILYPCEISVKDFQAWDSVILAYLFVFVVVALDKSLKDLDEGQETMKRTVAANCVSFLAFLASLNFWRGIWSIQDFYFFPDMNLRENLLLSHILGLVGTLVSRTSLTLTQSSAQDPDPSNPFGCESWAGRRLNADRQGYQQL